MKALVTSFISLLLFNISLFSAPVDQEKAARVAMNFYFERSNGVTFTITGTEIIGNGGLVLLYIFNGSPGGGYVVVSGDDRVYPVPAYSLNKNYFSGNSYQAPAFTAIMQDYADQILHHIDFSLPATPEAITAWGVYNVLFPSFNISSFLSVQPLLGPIEWGQGCYYNANCPYDASAGSGYCNRVPVGCVATSMSMVMKYWGWPTQGTGSHSYLHQTYGTLSANFGASTYNWALMPPVATSSNSEVAKICYHAGVSVEMNYGPNSSGAFMDDARYALIYRFGYSSGASLQWKSSYTTGQWDLSLKSELDSNKPVIYCGYDQVAGGHAWVIDGYQGVSNNHYHCNWGWDGYHNGYFYLTALTPGSYNFSNDHGAIIGIVPPVTQPPTANFTASVTNVAIGLPVTFTNQTTGSPAGYKWYFGDGDSSQLPNPEHYYTQPGQYSVKLVSWNIIGHDTLEKTNYITAFAPPLPVAEFSASSTYLPKGTPVQFTDLSSNLVTSWQWDFGDGQTSTVKNPQHIYLTADTFTVTLIVDNYSGSDTMVKSDYIVTNPGPPLPSFSASANIIYPGDTVFFADLTSNDPLEWYWQFGDGDTSTLQNPWHVYAAPGGYNVSLKVTNIYGDNELLKPGFVYVLLPPPLPMAWFSADRTTILKSETVIFTDYSFSNPFMWEWSFPGGLPSSSQQQVPGAVAYPDHGVYDVQLIVWNIRGSDTLLREKYINVGTIGTENLDMFKTIKIWPVPARDQVNISSESPVTTVVIRDISGRVVRSHDTEANGLNTVTIPLHSIPAGSYLLEIRQAQSAVKKQLLIAR